MRPKSRKSNESDDVSSKRLSTNMKPQTKSRSSESLGKSIDASGKRSPLAHHLLNTTRNVRLRRAPGSEESLGQTSQGRFTRQRAKANLFAGTSQVKINPNTKKMQVIISQDYFFYVLGFIGGSVRGFFVKRSFSPV